MAEAWDAIVIGSGPGGLTAALALARGGQRVVVLEQHYLPGGWTHSFTLDGYRFTPRRAAGSRAAHWHGMTQLEPVHRRLVPPRPRALLVRAEPKFVDVSGCALRPVAQIPRGVVTRARASHSGGGMQ